MEFLQLHYFCDAAESQNFSETARRFMVPVSNISQTIGRLERELGVPLFDRQKNRVSLNEAGKLYYREVKRAMRILDDAGTALSDRSPGVSGSIRMFIGCNRNRFPDLIRTYQSLYPEVSFRLEHRGVSDFSDFDLIVTDQQLPENSYEKKLLVHEKLLLGVSAGSVYAEKEMLSLRELRTAPFITLDCNSSIYRFTCRVCEEAGFSPNIAIECDDPTIMRRYIALGIGIGFVPSVSWKGTLSEQIVCRDIGDYYRDTYLYYRRDRYLKKCTRLLIDLMFSDGASPDGF